MGILWWIIAGVIIIAFIWISIVKSISAHKAQLVGGVEAFAGKTGTAKTDINPRGKFYVYGEYWDAEVEGEPLKEGERGEVVRLGSEDDKFLIVKRISK